MTTLTATDLALRLNVSKARVSQWVSEGKLEGCYTGAGRGRRFDLDAAKERLNRNLDRGQMLGNGRSTKQAIAKASASAPEKNTHDGAVSPGDLDAYELAKTEIAVQDARRKRRDNARDEGQWVLASEVKQASAKALSQEIAQFESVLREGARQVADRMGVDYRATRAVLIEVWRAHRDQRARALSDAAQNAKMTDAEKEADG